MQRLSLIACLLLGIGLFGCGLAEDVKEKTKEETTVKKEVDVPITFKINGDKLCETAEKDFDCSKKPTTEAPKDEISLGEIEILQSIDIVELTGRQELRQYAGKFEKVTISKVEYAYQDNTLSFGTPDLDILLAPKEAKESDYDTKFSDQTVKLTTIPGADPGTNADGTADVSSEAESKASDFFQDLKFSEISKGEPSIGGKDENQEKPDKVPPSGKTDVKITMVLKFVANAVGAVEN